MDPKIRLGRVLYVPYVLDGPLLRLFAVEYDIVEHTVLYMEAKTTRWFRDFKFDDQVPLAHSLIITRNLWCVLLCFES